MKFQKLEPKEPWSAEKTQERIDKVLSEIKAMNQEINKINSQLRQTAFRKIVLQSRISDKSKYLNQLRKQKEEIGWTEV